MDISSRPSFSFLSEKEDEEEEEVVAAAAAVEDLAEKGGIFIGVGLVVGWHQLMSL